MSEIFLPYVEGNDFIKVDGQCYKLVEVTEGREITHLAPSATYASCEDCEGAGSSSSGSSSSGSSY